MTARLVLVIGDLFIPDRAPDLPAKFRKLLTPGKIGQTLCLGNLTDRETYDFLREVAPDLQMVKGDYDVDSPNLPLSQDCEPWQSTNWFHPWPHHRATRRRRRIAYRGPPNGCRRPTAFEMEGRFFINPGSATGAMSSGFWPDGEEPTPSFCLMDIQGDVLVLYVYQLKTDANGVENVAVEKVSFRKNHPPAS
ncbi:Phosphodiesterase [Penicillium desertorum]|uniref:Phosphodiesterase n=1 Tax=Penicillium desertorum TaxID=1303715 RepID=A0A9W9WGC9_9EURO|nr:Phosphodiesterase [Penicillium desertorum]